jgi:hypothetical protein
MNPAQAATTHHIHWQLRCHHGLQPRRYLVPLEHAAAQQALSTTATAPLQQQQQQKQ